MRIRLALCVAAVLALAAGCDVSKEAPAVEKQTAMIDAAAPGLVRVLITFRVDKGEPPAGGYGERCPRCGTYHGGSYEQFVTEERPYEQAGFLVGPTTVVTRDPIVASRFVKDVSVRFGSQTVSAKIASWVRDRAAVLLELAEPLKDAKPLAFEPPGRPPYLALAVQEVDGNWVSSLQPFLLGLASEEGGSRYLKCVSNALVLDAGGKPVTLSMSDRVATDDSWKTPPRAWDTVSTTDLAKTAEAVDDACARTVVRVKLAFRSPRKEQGSRGGYRGDVESDDGSTEMNLAGVVASPERVLVLAGLKPSITARLEKITLCTGAGEVPAKFLCTLTDYGALVVTPETPLAAPAPISDDNDVAKLRDRLLLAAEVKIQGENRVVVVNPARILRFNVGWRRQVVPDIAGNERSAFLFDTTGRLVALPVARREKGTSDRWSRDNPTLTGTGYLTGILANPAAVADANNVPLSEEQENRMAWLGVEFQRLNRALARLNKVSDLTNDGETGAIVSAVYPDSPAAIAGLKVGDILLRVHVEGYPKPIDVRIEEYDFSERAFPWERLDMISEQYYDQIPKPWPSVSNSLIAALTDVGFGKKFDAEIFRDGKTIMVPLTVTESPAHFDSAARFKSKPLGLTARDLTYEARRYFQRKTDEPGVIISNIEAGSKASVAGLKPYEIITAVNEKPVKDVKEFEAAVTAGGDELRLNVLRMTKTRIVKISLKGGETSRPQPPVAAPPPPATEDEGE